MPEYTAYSDRLGGWPLPTMADGSALHAARTKVFSAVGVRKYWKEDALHPLSSLFRAFCARIERSF